MSTMFWSLVHDVRAIRFNLLIHTAWCMQYAIWTITRNLSCTVLGLVFYRYLHFSWKLLNIQLWLGDKVNLCTYFCFAIAFWFLSFRSLLYTSFVDYYSDVAVPPTDRLIVKMIEETKHKKLSIKRMVLNAQLHLKIAIIMQNVIAIGNQCLNEILLGRTEKTVSLFDWSTMQNAFVHLQQLNYQHQLIVAQNQKNFPRSFGRLECFLFMCMRSASAFCVLSRRQKLEHIRTQTEIGYEWIEFVSVCQAERENVCVQWLSTYTMHKNTQNETKIKRKTKQNNGERSRKKSSHSNPNEEKHI